MSLRFFYEPLPPVRFRRSKEVNFYTSSPPQTVKESVSEPTEEKKIRQTTERREHRTTREPKQEKSRVPELSLVGKSLFDCDLLLEKLMSQRSLKSLCNLTGSQLDTTFGFSEQYPNISDLSGIRRKIKRCEYENASEVYRALMDLFKAFEDVLGPDRGRTVSRYRSAIKKAFDAVEVDTGYAHLKSELSKMASIEVGEIGRELGQEDDCLVKLTAALNALTPREKLRAEWIIRQHFPTLPSYEEGIDVRMLTGGVIDELVSRFETLRVEGAA